MCSHIYPRTSPTPGLRAATGRPLPEVISLFAALLPLPASVHYLPLTVSPQRQKQQTLDALVA